MWEEPLTADSLTPASGASYIEMPRSLPPDGKASAWLSAEGVLGLVWGEGSWFGSPIASKTFGHASGVTPKSRLRRDIRSELKGTVYAGPPSGLVYPTFIEVNGTRYTEEGVDGSVYKDAAGNVLNLAQLGDVIESHAK